MPELFWRALALPRSWPRMGTLLAVSSQVNDGIFATERALAFVVASEICAAAAVTSAA